MTKLVDKKIKCVDCKKEFDFTIGEQEFFLKKAYVDPRRCKSCRKIRKNKRHKKKKDLLNLKQVIDNKSINNKNLKK